ncbi:MAG: hypothetical protein H8F28_05815, partial [Fibrella sp.]|nr:hypothetical protein [Armatimonadota bacterium]
MLVLARVMTKGALQRDESRGAHYKPDFPDRDDANFLKTTVAEHSSEGPTIRYEEVDISQVTPRQRKYTTDTPAKKVEAVQISLNGHKNGTNGHVNGHANGVNGHANGYANGTNGYSNGATPISVPGEAVLVGGGTGENDPLTTAPSNAPRDGGSGTAQSDKSPNMADIKPGTGGAN